MKETLATILYAFGQSLAPYSEEVMKKKVEDFISKNVEAQGLVNKRKDFLDMTFDERLNFPTNGW